jgi:hypothetical protein
MQRFRVMNIGHTETGQTGGRPKWFVEDDREVFIWPKPTATENGQTVSMLHAYETDDATALRDEHQHIAILYAAAKAKQKDRMFEEAALLLSQYYNAVTFERQDKFDMGVDPIASFKQK